MNVKVKREKQKKIRKMYRHSNIPLKKEEVEFHFETSFSQNLKEKLKKVKLIYFDGNQ